MKMNDFLQSGSSGVWKVRIGISGGMIHAVSSSEPKVELAEDGKTVQSVVADWTEDGDHLLYIRWSEITALSCRHQPGQQEISAAADGTPYDDTRARSRLEAVSKVAESIRDHPRSSRRDIQLRTGLPGKAVTTATNDLYDCGKVTRVKRRKSYIYSINYSEGTS